MKNRIIDSEDDKISNDNIDFSNYNEKVSSSKLPKNFNKKFFMFAFLIILLSFFAAFFLKRCYAIVGEENVTFQENSNLNYKVYLKPNNFYEKDYLDKDMVYIASLIDKIDIDFNYVFKIEKKNYIDFDYDIIGKLVISDKSKGKVFFNKEYVLLENTKESVFVDEVHQINKNISIDYGMYNSLANQFRSQYGVDASCNLIIYLNVHEKNVNQNNFVLNNNSAMSLTIPLSERSVNISMDYNEVNKISKLVRDSEFVITNYLYLVCGIVCLLILLIIIVKFVKLILRLRVKRSKYDRYVGRLLREYDRLIVETSTMPILEGKHIVEISKFQELLDVRDNLKLPIKYCVVKAHKMSYFYISYEEEVYLFVVLSNNLK